MNRHVVDCPTYEPIAGNQRCRHYLANGACALPTMFMCVLWERANGHLRDRPHDSGESCTGNEVPDGRGEAGQGEDPGAGAHLVRPPRDAVSPPATRAPSGTAPRLSYSRVSLWEQCRLAYRFRYHDRLETGESKDAAELGKAVHAALEAAQREHVREERRGALSRESATLHWRRAFNEAGLAGADVFQQGLEMVLGFLRDQGELDPYDILAIEQSFELRLGAHTVIGFMDRVDRIDDETVGVVDFKTSRMLFNRDELESNLQLSVYALAARQLWPWAKRIRLTMWMLRHGIRQETTRSPEQLEAASEYVQAMGEQIARATEYPAKPNTLCGYCEYRRHCPAYAEMLKGKHELAAESLDDLEQVAREREEVAAIAKATYRRQRELDDVLKARLTECDELVLAGVRYSTFRVTTNAYPLDRTVELLSRASGMPEDQVRARIASVDNPKVKALLGKVAKARGRANAALVEAELGALAKQRHTQRIWGKPIKEVRT